MLGNLECEKSDGVCRNEHGCPNEAAALENTSRSL